MERTLCKFDLTWVLGQVRLNRKRGVFGEHRPQSSEEGVRARNGETRREDRLNEGRLAEHVLGDPASVPVREAAGSAAEGAGSGGGGQDGGGGELERGERRRGGGEGEVPVRGGDGGRRDAVGSHEAHELLRIGDALRGLRRWRKWRSDGVGQLDDEPTSPCS